MNGMKNLSIDDLNEVNGGTMEDMEKAIYEMFDKYGVSDVDALKAVISDDDFRSLFAELSKPPV